MAAPVTLNKSHEAEHNKNEQVPIKDVEGGQDPPDGRLIRGQVEFYFSDENLRTDLFLLQCCSGRENEGVSISRICGFKKMRKWKKKDVVAALRLSKKLEVVENGKKVKRRVPLEGKCLLDPDFVVDTVIDDPEIAYDPRSKRAIVYPVPKVSQNRQRLPQGTTKNMQKPTGFEDSYVEGPLTPAEAADELAMYDPEKALVERLEIAIQRFKQKRRMHEMYSKVFNKWMKFGGVENEPRMFGGLSKQDLKEMSAEEIARATAIHQIPWDREDTTKWTLDFVGVAEAFLASYYPNHFGHNESEVKTACQVLRSFYNYLLFHSVCDEHRDRILAARALCDKAEKELPKSHRVGIALPGSFNVAASVVFGGTAAAFADHSTGWATEGEGSTEVPDNANTAEATLLFQSAMELYGTDEQRVAVVDLDPATLGTVKSIVTGLEVVAIELATEEQRTRHEQMQSAKFLDKDKFEPLGKLICKPWATPDFKEYDLPASTGPNKDVPEMTYTFWIEESILEDCFIGLKLDAKVLTVPGGMHVLDEVKETFVSFYKILPNEMWEAKKVPKLRLLNRHLPREELEELENGEGQEHMPDGAMSDDE
ncbi:hypothetical protein M011DRAFT_409002 [Sporormia fimetaria CBS 119925]|uniref:HTH La-type RNA-binding domain-containing protein n=1 Tax=Sporormia fimetaria CBS 119925 TaxID=1340428 RepID=A0A6A6V4J6_9PLEO|nr:hypothetical protein M011DRAFT_409002 [Sporormia fimetaria CBS 119925]